MAPEILATTNEFEQGIVVAGIELINHLIEQNRKWGDSYRATRLECEEIFNSRKVPFFFHIKEKLSRYMNSDDVDSTFDSAGYSLLEVVCRRLDD